MNCYCSGLYCIVVHDTFYGAVKLTPCSNLSLPWLQPLVSSDNRGQKLSPREPMSPGVKFGKWGEPCTTPNRHYFVIANTQVRVPCDAVTGSPQLDGAPKELSPRRMTTGSNADEEIRNLQQQLSTRVRVERSLRQAKITADELRSEAEHVCCVQC